MMPEEWPITANAGDRLVDPARARGPSRLATVRRDFFLDPGDRLTEQERALMTAMLHDLVGTLANEIAVAAGFRKVDRDSGEIAATLANSGLVDRAGLVSLMLRRADEYRIAASFSGHSGPRRLPLLPRLVSDQDAGVAAAAMALVVARGRRRDAFGQPRLELCDLDPADALALAHSVAAVLSPGRREDGRLSMAAASVAASTVPADQLDQATEALLDAIDASARNSDELIEQASSEGEVALVASFLSRRSGVGPQAAWDHLLNSGEGGLALLARMAGLPRPLAARLIADLGGSTGPLSVEDEIARFDNLTDDDVASAHAHWQLPRDYRNARIALGERHG
ncbi:MAG: DUF2336 domain-containing protein [Sphingomicrobium sp.]